MYPAHATPMRRAHHSRPVQRHPGRIYLRTVAALVAMLACLTAFSVTSASAHDTLVGSSPGDRDRLDDPPREIVLEFDATPMEVGAAIMVVDADGTDHRVGDPTVAAGQVRIELDRDLPEGGYEIRWRVVSSDGHPISGVVAFAVGDGEFLEPRPADEVASGTNDPTERANPAQAGPDRSDAPCPMEPR